MESKILNRFFNEENGQSVIIVAIFMTLLLGITAFTADAGFLFFQRRNMQNAADAAALAGARELIEDASNVQSVVTNYVTDHGIDASDIEPPIINDNRVTVVLKGARPLFFARLFGLDGTNVSARATAAVGNIVSFRGGAPFAVPEEAWDGMEKDNEFTLYAKFSPGQQGDSPLGSGNWATINFIGSGASNDLIREWLEFGYNGEVSVDDTIYTAPGVGLNSALDILNKLKDDEVPLVIPIIDSAPPGSQPVIVTGFAAIVITDVKSTSGNPNNPNQQGQIELTAKVINPNEESFITSGEITEDPDYDFGVKGVALVE